jgi:hypothetical protein
MTTTARKFLAALFATVVVHAAEGPPPANGPTPPAQLVSLPLGWSLMGNGGPLALPGSCDIGVDSQKSFQGKQLYSIRCTNNVLPSFGGARQSIADAARFRGKRVRVSAWLMASGIEAVANPQYPGAAGEGGLWLGVGSARQGQRTDRMQDRAIKGSTDWELRDFVVDIPEDNDLLQVGYWMQGKGQIWMRDVTVEEVPNTVAVNFPGNLAREKGPDFSLLAVARADERFLPPPAKWLAMGATGFELCDIGVDAQLLKSGTRNLSIACSIPQSAVLRQTPEALPWWNKRVRFSAWIRTERMEPLAGGAQDGGVAMYLSATATQSPTLTARVTGNSDWQYREVVMDIPQGSVYLPLGFSLTGSGQMWARDLKFEEVSRDTPVTPSSAIR